MKIFATSAFTLVALSCAALAGDDVNASLYANTLVYTSPDKVVTKVLVNKDGSWTSTASKGKPARGNWAQLGNFVCISDDAMKKTPPVCYENPGMHKVGDKWTEPGDKKGTVDQVTLMAGR